MKNRKIVCFSNLSFFTNGMLAIITSSMINYMMKDYGFSYNQVAILLSLQSFGNMIMGAFSGLLIRRFGRKKLVISFPILFVLGCSGIIYSNHYSILCICIILTGFGWGICNNIIHLLINEKENNQGNITMLHTMYAIGAFVGPFVLMILLRLEIDWKVALYIISVLSVIVLFGFKDYRDLSETENCDSNDVKAYALEKFWKEPRYYLCILMYFCYIGLEGGVNAWLVNFLYQMQRMKFSDAQAMLSILWLVIIVSRGANIIFLKYIKPQWMLCIEGFGIFVTMGMVLYNSNTMINVLLIILLGLFMGGISPCNALNASRYIKGTGIASGILFAGGGIGSMVLPLCIGVVTQTYSVTRGMYCLLGIMGMLFIFSIINIMLFNNKKANIRLEK